MVMVEVRVMDNPDKYIALSLSPLGLSDEEKRKEDLKEFITEIALVIGGVILFFAALGLLAYFNVPLEIVFWIIVAIVAGLILEVWAEKE